MKAPLSHRLAGGVLLALLTVSVPGFAASPALAGGFEGSVQERIVDYGDLNLADARSVARLHARLRVAAHAVCGSPDPLYLRIRQVQKDCIEQAVTEAVRKIDHPGLNAYHARSRLSKFAQARAATRVVPGVTGAH